MVSDRSSRRSFLQGRARVESALADAPATPQGSEQPPVPPAAAGRQAAPPSAAADLRSLLVSVRRRAMACEWEVQTAANRNDDSMEFIFQALDLVEALESQMTIYRPDSEVVHLNRAAAAGPVAVEPRLFEIFLLARQLFLDTDGAYDITSGPLSDIWGFSRRQGQIPSDEEIAGALARVGLGDVEFDEANSMIAFSRPGVCLNLNSVGKGYALDRMAELLAVGAVDDYLLHGGRSSVLARGDHPGQSARGWSIGLRHPLRPTERLAEFRLHDESLSTSGSGTQFFERRGRRYGHILDPRTGQPVEGIYSATVIAPTAAEADALSTAFYVLGPEQTAEYCQRHPAIRAFLVCRAERAGDIRVHAINLDDQWRNPRTEPANR